MQKRPSTRFVPKTLGLRAQFMAGLGNFELHPYCAGKSQSFHDCTEFVYCHSGSGEILCEGQKFEFGEGDVLYISPYMPHYIYKTGKKSCRCEFIHVNLSKMFDPVIFKDLIEFTEQLLVPFSVLPVIHGAEYPVFRELIGMMLKEMGSYKPYLEMSIKGYCMSVAAQLKAMWELSEEDKKSEGKADLYAALIYMNRHYSKDISIPELAAICHLSETHFRRLFKSKFSMSPLEYLNHIRLTEACILLCRNSILISQAAEQAGFRTLSSFNRKFRDVMGMAPSQWVKLLPDMDDKPQVIFYG